MIINLTKAQVDELSQFLFWIEDRELEGGPWWRGEEGPIRFEGDLWSAIEKVHTAYRKLKGIK